MTGFRKNSRRGFVIATTLGLVAVLAISGCGRRGPPEAPASAKVLSTNPKGEVVEEPAPVYDRPFILDPLLQ